MNKELLVKGLKKLGLNDCENEIRLLGIYINELELWNKKYGLVNASGDEIITKHILDSLAPLSVLKEYSPKTIADIGSGAGLPGILLGIFLKDVRISLVERSGKRANFLNNVLALLSLDNIEVVNKDIKEVKDKYDIVVFRAFRQIDEFINDLLRIKNPDGYLFAYKGKRETINSEINLIKDKIILSEIKPLKVPYLNDERNILIIK